MKMTKARKAIYKIFEGKPMPLSAVDIYELLENRGIKIWMSTVYRTLEVFEENEMIVKTPIPGSDQDHYIIKDSVHKHYAICLTCKNIIGDLACPMAGYADSLDRMGFKPVDHKFIVYGYCSNCQ